MNLEQGAMGPTSELTTLIRFWAQMEKLHYPMAADMKKSLEEQLADTQAAQVTPAQTAPVQVPGAGALTGGTGGILPAGGEVTA